MSMQQPVPGRALRVAALSALLAGAATAQSARPIAFVNARIVPVSGDVIERGTLVVRNGKIDAVGKDVTVPAGARVVDASGKTIMPGLVSAVSRAGLVQARPTSRSNTPRRGRRRNPHSSSSGSSSRTVNQAATKVVDGLYARQPVFGELLEVGVTSLALNPPGSGFPGLGAVLDPSGKGRDALTLDDDAFVQIGMARNASAKKLLKETFAKAKKVVEEREKPKEEPKAKQPEPAKPKADGDKAKGDDKKDEKGEQKQPPKPSPKPGDGKDDKPQGKDGKAPPKPAAKKPAPKKPKDPNLEVLADLLQGKRRAIVEIRSAADLLHWRTAVDDEVTFPRCVAVPRHDTQSGTIDMVLEHLKKWQCSVLLSPSLTTLPRTAHLTNPAKKLHDAGVEVGFLLGDTPKSARDVFFRLMELVRAGLPADAALKAVTLVPAKALGIDKRTGSLEVGKDADLLVFDGDPLSPAGKLDQVWLRGAEVER